MRVALTGGIASGKSAVAEMLRSRGAQVSQSDEVARAMMRPGEPLYRSIVVTFGQQVVMASGGLDRSALARLAFQEGRLQELNALVHPAVLEAQERWLRTVEQQDPAAVAVVESALVLETPFHPAGSGEGKPWRTRFDRIVVVSADEAIRQARYLRRVAEASVVTRSNVVADFKARAAAQWSDAAREQMADAVLHNEGSLAELEVQVSNLYASLRAAAAGQAAAAPSPGPASNMG